jgi:hypothetical protein
LVPAPLLCTLSSDGQAALEQCETSIAQARQSYWQSYLKVGLALARIQNEKLYRDKYSDFEEYMRQRWGYSRSYGYKLIDSATAVEALRTDKELESVWTNVHTPILPNCEGQARQLLGLNPEDRAKAWKNALQLAGGQEVTSNILKKAIEPFKKEPQSRSKSKKSADQSAKLPPDWIKWFVQWGQDFVGYISQHPEHAAGIEAHLQALVKQVQQARAVVKKAKRGAKDNTKNRQTDSLPIPVAEPEAAATP